MSNLEGNRPIVLITGALADIGRATALAFAHEGVRIVVSRRRGEAGQASGAELRKTGAEIEFIRADVSNEKKLA
jgi:NAD(P)-dependent dehydrogenase (short-subunit alcohol dehydrogenase family)